MKDESEEHPHRRYNPLTGEWVLVSPQRTKRPWGGQVEKAPADTRPAYEPECYLCPGNERAGGVRNPQYESTFVFTNDFAALLPDTPQQPAEPSHNLFHRQCVPGTCRVVCFSPQHNLTLPEMPASQIRQVVDVWADQTAELGRQYHWVQVFENKGAMMGCSNQHPHGQIWAQAALPNQAVREDNHQRAYFQAHGRPLLQDYGREETRRQERIVLENDHWIAFVPYWAVWPFEILLLPKHHFLRLPGLDEAARQALAKVLKALLIRYDNLFKTSFPYSMGWHGAPFHGDDSQHQHWLLHAHFYPPLLRSATVKKFMVGYEMLAEPQRDLTAEQAARRLRETSAEHYLSSQAGA
jgi:UDPglucose--hexose-1-phosphate uridylyltransferase